MNTRSSDFALDVEGIGGKCPAGEAHAKENIGHGPLGQGGRQKHRDRRLRLRRHGRALKGLIGEERLFGIDAFPMHKRYSEVFLMDDVPPAERDRVARRVADQIVVMLRDKGLCDRR